MGALDNHEGDKMFSALVATHGLANVLQEVGYWLAVAQHLASDQQKPDLAAHIGKIEERCFHLWDDMGTDIDDLLMNMADELGAAKLAEIQKGN